MPPSITRLMLSALLLMPAGAHAAADSKSPQVIWGYMGGGNDDEGWGTLTPDFITCDTGQNQSPVGIGETNKSAMAELNFHYQKASMRIEKKDRTVVITMKNGGTVSDHGHIYTLKEMRIHTPAEHEVVGKIYPAEIHMIHRDDQGKMLIVGVFMDFEYAGTNALHTILDKAPAKTKTIVSLALNPEDLLPKKRGYYAYSGSLSWPPCTEGVEWRVMKSTTALSKAQMTALGKLLGRNARLLQPIYLRTIKETIN